MCLFVKFPWQDTHLRDYVSFLALFNHSSHFMHGYLLIWFMLWFHVFGAFTKNEKHTAKPKVFVFWMYILLKKSDKSTETCTPIFFSIFILIIITVFQCLLPLSIRVKEETVRFDFWECLDECVLFYWGLYLCLALTVLRAPASVNASTVARYLQSLCDEVVSSSYAIFLLSPGNTGFT